MAANKSFWGLIVKPDKRYEQTVEESFHISKACLEPQNPGGGGITSVYIDVDGEEFVLCNLGQKSLNETLDLNFSEGEKICFRTSGAGTVHLTGYLIDEDGPIMVDDDEDSDEEAEEDVPTLAQANGSKRKGTDLPPSEKKRAKLESVDKAAAIKKAEEMRAKVVKAAESRKEAPKDDDDDDESSGEEEEDEDEEMGEEGEEEEDDEDSDDDEMEEDEDSDEEEKKTPKKELNGTATIPKSEKKQKGQDMPPKGDKTPGKSHKDEKNKDKQKTPGKDQKTPGKDKQQQQQQHKTPGKENQGQKSPTKTPKRTLKGGIVVEDLKVGGGPEAKRGKTVGMYYEGKLASNNKTFDSTLNGKPFNFKLGFGEVIKGWDVGLEGMKVGGKRKLTIPAKMAYGQQGQGEIPPNSTLVFTVECKYVK